MQVLFNFNNGESKRLDKPLANLLASRGDGEIANHEKNIKPPADKSDKVIKRRSKKSR
jgi:hypothetical protein